MAEDNGKNNADINAPSPGNGKDPGKPKSFFIRVFTERKGWTAIWVVAGFLLGIWAINIYSCYYPLSYGSALLWALAYFACGGIGGFIFGVPKIITNTPPADQSNQINTNQKKIVQENTNLTQISDWLTKVIIGAGLVELKQIPGFVLDTAREMAKGISKDAEYFSQSTILCAAIIIYFSVWGFISGYLVMRLVITDLLADDDA